MPLSPGDAVRVVNTKWGELPHWEFDAHYLGRDEHGDWLGVPVGTPFARPGLAFVAQTDQVVLVPGPEAGGAGWWIATFHAPGHHVATYVDMTTRPVWDGALVSAVDLDLDIVEPAEGDVFVDDEDEFAEHRVAFGYPADVVAGAEASCAWVHDAVRDRTAPFDGPTSSAWLARVSPS